MKNFNPIKKLVFGISLFTFGFFMIYIVGENGWDYCEKRVYLFLNTFLPEGLAKFTSLIFSVVLGFYSVKSIISGAYKMFTFHHYLECFDSDSSGRCVFVKNNALYPNINRALEFRDSKMAGMNNGAAAQFLNSTSKLDSLYFGYNSGPNTQRALSFVESRMAGMSNERAIQYLQGKIS